MNWDRIEGNWKQLKGRIQVLWGILVDDQLDRFDGTREQQEGVAQEQCGIAKDEARRQLKDFRKRNRNWNLSKVS